ncbi:hypothetical protein [Lactobacillus kalixensis]|nr:hypothetical protein [Lactobacillus kalixensis]
MKRKILIILPVILILILIAVVYKHNMDYSKEILRAEVATDNNTHNSFIQIYSSGKTKKGASFSDSQSAQAVSVDPNVFRDETDSENKTTRISVKKKLLHQNKKLVADSTFVKIVNEVVNESHHLIGVLNLFKLDNDYYAFVKYNAGLSDDGTLYKYDRKLVKVCTIDSGKIIRLQKIGE